MKINSAKFLKGVTGPDAIFMDGRPQVAFIGRSNVGKSSVINAITHQKDLAKTSSFPGLTKEINFFLINNSFYIVDLPGYGYAKLPAPMRAKIKEMINWYFFSSGNEQNKIFLIIDAEVGPTKDDLELLYVLEEKEKTVVVVANKIDKIKKSAYATKLSRIQVSIGNHKIIPCSTKNSRGIQDIIDDLK